MPRPVFHRVFNESVIGVEPCLGDWCKYVVRYCQEVKEDAPWVYNERAVLSTFAAAVAQNNGLAIEEFIESKRYGRGYYDGRVDLWFRLGRRKKGFVVEAKIGWLWMPDRERKLRSKCKRWLSRATYDVRQLKNDYGDTRLGFAFIVPGIKRQANVKKELDTIQRLVLEQVRPDALAWVFPPLPKPMEEKNRILPGVILLVRVA